MTSNDACRLKSERGNSAKKKKKKSERGGGHLQKVVC